MIKINCTGCHSCCSHPKLTPVLLDLEISRFEDFSKIIKTPKKDMHILKKKDNGKCIFLDDKSHKCTIYSERPLECRLYPFLLDFSAEKTNVKIDNRFCPHLSTLNFNKELILKELAKHEFSNAWIKAYISMEDY